jgi:signal transduction histidine kinase/ActR/RegA family two-component response regulator
MTTTISTDDPTTDAPSEAASGATTALPTDHGHGWAGAVPIILLVVLAAGAVVASLATHNLVANQQRRLLRQRTDQVADRVSSSADSFASAFRLIGGAYLVEPERPVAFESVARTTVGSGVSAVGVAAVDGDRVTVRKEVASGSPRAELTGVRADTARRALAHGSLASAFVGDSGARREYFRAVSGPARTVTYIEGAVTPTSKDTIEAAHRDGIDYVVYASAEANPRTVITDTTGGTALRGPVVRRSIRAGADRWLLLASAKGSLVGSFSPSVPWIILGVGLAGAVLAAATAGSLVRRRRYVLKVVDARTAELQRTHVDLDTARSQAEAANRSKSEFLSRMSHELRTPLNAVLGFAQLLELDDLTPEQHESVGHIVKGGRHLLDLINEVLDISRIETGNLALSAEAVRVADLIDEAMDLMGPLAAQSGIQLHRDETDDGHTHVQADRQRLKQVILNLLSNAVKYNRTGGSVTIGSRRVEGGRIRVFVSDTGPGIPLDQQALLFVPFERLGAAETSVEGTGIGLTLSRRLAEAMGGVLDLESVPGRGSTFWIELPLAEDPVASYQRHPAPAPSSTAPAGEATHQLLYVEDNLANLRLIERILETRPELSLMSAMQGRIGLELACEHQPAAILLDLHLPDTSGEDVLRELRAEPRTAPIPVVMVTADATPGQAQRLLALGARAVLTKPIDVQELLSVLDDVLADVERDRPAAGSPR